MNEHDYALVIGISRYLHLEHAKTAQVNVRAFVEWLRNPERGGVPPENITLVTSDNEQAVTAIVPLPEQSGRRLYLYVAGRSAFSDYRGIVILFADATTEHPHAFDPRQLALEMNKAFEEIVLIVDGEPSTIHKVPVREKPILPHEVAPRFFEVISHGDITPSLTSRLINELAPSYDAVTSNSLALRLAPGSLSIASGGGPIVFFDALPLAERVSAQSDDPARVDALQRRAFAEVMGTRMQEVWDARGKSDERGAFMVHIHGPWGSGKSTVLNLLRDFLQEETRAERWVVVEFNAWKQQRLKPPWWALIHEVYGKAAAQLGVLRSLPVRLVWLWWRARADWFPLLMASVLLLLAIVIAVVFESATAVTIIAAILAGGAAIATFSRTLIFGSARAAQTYTDLRNDPLSPIVSLFRHVISAVRRPVAIFIDDLDRCDSAYVVELLEGIQTLFRSGAVTYVVAADRKWICRSFDKTYETFGGTIGDPGRPLGYLFLEKVFQISAPVPGLARGVRDKFWRTLLHPAEAPATDEERKAAEAEALASVKSLTTKEQLDRKIAEVRGHPVLEPAMRAAAAKQITSVEATKATEHQLQRFADLIDPNPRAMKRLVNAFGLHQATHFIEERNVSAETLARWTIVELRWPLLAEYLAENPAAAGVFHGNATIRPPRELRTLFADDEVKKVFASALDEANIRRLTGIEVTS